MSETPDAIAALASVWADIGERTGDYVAVWRAAIQRNGADDYRAADLLGDVETLWGMAIGDAARFGAAVVDAAAPLLAGFVQSASDGSDATGESG